MASDFFPTLDDLDAEEVDVNDESLGDVSELTLDEDSFLTDGVEETLPYGTTWKFDFNEGDISIDREGQFQQIMDYETLRDWIGHTLNTIRFETPIFGGDIGTTIPNLIGQVNTNDPVVMGRVEQEIIEAISIHDRIQQVHQAVTIPLGNDLFIYIKYTTDDQVTQTEVVGL